jgi:hypothetical protein
MCSALYVTCLGSFALTRRLTADLYEHSNHVTQSISLSNINPPSFAEEGPALRLLKPARLREPASRSLSPHIKEAAIWKQ